MLRGTGILGIEILDGIPESILYSVIIQFSELVQ
jgi:hypothetical protein